MSMKKKFLVVSYDVTGWTDRQIGALELEATAQAEDNDENDEDDDSRGWHGDALERCWFCDGAWGECRCRWPDATAPRISGRALHVKTIDTGDTLVTEPNVSECGRFYVDPVAYYGAAFKRFQRSL